MKKIKFISLAILLIFYTINPVLAEDDFFRPPMNIGASLNLNFNMHSPSFSYPLNSSEIQFDKNANSLGAALGLIGNFPITDYITFSGRIGYNMLNGELEKDNYKLKTSLSTLEITPAVQVYNLFPIRPLYLLGAIELGLPLSKNYNINDNGTELVPDTDIPDASFRMALGLGVGYTFKLSDKIYLSPEASFRIPFTKVSSSDAFKSWDVPQLRLGVNLTFGIGGGDGSMEENENRYLNVGMSDVRYYDNNGNTKPIKRVKVEEVKYMELFPLVPYVFFPESQATPTANTQIVSDQATAGDFQVQNLETNALKINLATLDIIGSRMRQYPKTQLTITGTNDSKNEGKNKSLALERAEFAKNYLVKKFSIESSRIQTKEVGLPAKASSIKVDDGIEENRRIEFSSINPELLAPIIIDSENQTISDPNLAEFVPVIESSEDIKTWTLEVSQAGKELQKFDGIGQPVPLQWSIHPNQLQSNELPVEYRFNAETESGLKKSISGTIPVEYISKSKKKTEQLQDKVVSKFSLVLFDFDKADITKPDLDILNQYVLPEIKFNSNIKIFGYTDRIGDKTYNKGLAERRANEVKKFLLSKGVKESQTEVVPIGE
ncbi:MAG TPA: OmpA family protein, partial [Candidatus Kapabacteria bacterium]|nr:OmpA family protein [Candidatus Kapabacteria bacterium]